MIKEATSYGDVGSAPGTNILIGRNHAVTNESFRWTQEYSVNKAALDRQHQKLFDTVNELHAALRTGIGNVVLDEILEQLEDYAHTHFADEESLMEQHAFPGLSAHRVQHQMFREKMADFLAQHKAGRAGVPVELMLFMQDWLKQHVLKTDKQYSAFLNARGVQ